MSQRKKRGPGRPRKTDNFIFVRHPETGRIIINPATGKEARKSNFYWDNDKKVLISRVSGLPAGYNLPPTRLPPRPPAQEDQPPTRSPPRPPSVARAGRATASVPQARIVEGARSPRRTMQRRADIPLTLRRRRQPIPPPTTQMVRRRRKTPSPSPVRVREREIPSTRPSTSYFTTSPSPSPSPRRRRNGNGRGGNGNGRGGRGGRGGGMRVTEVKDVMSTNQKRTVVRKRQ